ncbi:MAG: acyl-CoA dehydrogenase family protein [Sphingomonadales bacterium]|nr:acyl-CoA dehydrogenase family protein [Sphingomonadales bacterium]
MLKQTSSADARFAAEVRAFLDRALTPELRAASDRQTGVFAEPALAARWHRILHAQGWIAPSWPREHGGPGWTPRERLIFERECALANSPVLPAMGLNMCGPVLIGHGTAEQQARFLPAILSGEHTWCQGYSEPGAGSDLAALKCRAVRDGDDYVIDGTKIWTTFAHAANWMFLLARTDPEVRPQAGISFLLVPMDAPGVTVTPIRSMSGEHEVNQVFLDGVRIPVANRVGAENAGWTVAKYLLEFERGGVAATARTLRIVGQLERLARAQGGLPPDILHRLAELEIEIRATEETQQRMLAQLDAGQSVGNTNASILKLKASELYQQASRLFLDAVGEWGLVDQAGALFHGGPAAGPEIVLTAAARFLNARALSIFGGSSEIQKSILAKQALKL